MAASDLFVDHNDASFRLVDTHLIIGRDIFYVESVCPGSEIKSIFLEGNLSTKCTGYDSPTPRVFNLSKLSVLTMFNCPSGYIGDEWFSRGPLRARYQGLRRTSLWGRDVYGDWVPPPERPLWETLAKLLRQPKIYTGSAAVGGVTRTNKVRISKSGGVLHKGAYIGEYHGNNKIKLSVGYLTIDQIHDLANANLRIM